MVIAESDTQHIHLKMNRTHINYILPEVKFGFVVAKIFIYLLQNLFISLKETNKQTKNTLQTTKQYK